MRTILNINKDWSFVKNFAEVPAEIPAEAEKISIPHTWNNIDGQDGGNDYFRGTCCYVKTIEKAELPEGDRVFLEINGANSSAKAYVNGKLMQEHHGGYSTWRMDITDELAEINTIAIFVDNAANEEVYPQTADFTFYGGIYRDINLIGVPATHFDLATWGTPSIKVTPIMNGEDCNVEVEVAIENAQAGDEVMATECPVVFPQGIGVVPWMVPGGRDIAVATSELMKQYDVAIWAHHGMFAAGEDFDLTFGLMHTVEKSAETLVKMLSMRPDKLQTITPQDFRDLAVAFGFSSTHRFAR